MDIKWDVIAFTVVNVGVMFWLLSKLLFKPVKEFMDNRILSIQKDIKDAEELKQNAQKLKEDYESKIQDINEEKTEILIEAKKKGDKIYEERVDEATAEAEKVKERQRREIEQERAQMVDDLKKDTVNIALNAASKILSEELSKDKHKQLIAGFIDNLK